MLMKAVTLLRASGHRAGPTDAQVNNAATVGGVMAGAGGVLVGAAGVLVAAGITASIVPALLAVGVGMALAGAIVAVGNYAWAYMGAQAEPVCGNDGVGSCPPLPNPNSRLKLCTFLSW
jgi:hypothetical protein